MTRFSGKGGSALVGTALFHINRWNVTTTADLRQMDAFGDTWGSSYAGVKRGAFSCDGFLDSAAASIIGVAQTGATVQLTLLQDTTIGITGIGVIGSFDVTVGIDGTADASLSGEFQGAVNTKTT